MLILSRRIHESIRIGKDISVTVLGFNGNQVRLGIQAPQDVGIHREEVAERIKAEGGDPADGSSRRRLAAMANG